MRNPARTRLSLSPRRHEAVRGSLPLSGKRPIEFTNVSATASPPTKYPPRLLRAVFHPQTRRGGAIPGCIIVGETGGFDTLRAQCCGDFVIGPILRPTLRRSHSHRKDRFRPPPVIEAGLASARVPPIAVVSALAFLRILRRHGTEKCSSSPAVRMIKWLNRNYASRHTTVVPRRRGIFKNYGLSGGVFFMRAGPVFWACGASWPTHLKNACIAGVSQSA